MCKFDKAAEIFKNSWSIYSKVVNKDYMTHKILNNSVRIKIDEKFGDESLRVIELGCGDGTQALEIFKSKNINYYYGCDLSEFAIKNSVELFSKFFGNFNFLCVDLLKFLGSQKNMFDIFYSSFTLHHLDLSEKRQVAGHANRLLDANGLVVIVDIFREPGQSRDSYLNTYMSAVSKTWLDFDQLELDAIETHIRQNDFPETIEEYFNIFLDEGFPYSRVNLANGPHKMLTFSRVPI